MLRILATRNEDFRARQWTELPRGLLLLGAMAYNLVSHFNQKFNVNDSL